MVRVYRRCNGGHYFADACCPLDGWFSAETDEVLVAAERLIKAGITPSIERLREAGLGSDVPARTIVIDFGNEACAFDAVAPEGYVIGGRWIPLFALEAAFM